MINVSFKHVCDLFQPHIQQDWPQCLSLSPPPKKRFSYNIFIKLSWLLMSWLNLSRLVKVRKQMLLCFYMSIFFWILDFMPIITFVLLLKTEGVKICILNRIISLQQQDYEGSQHLHSFSYFNSLVTEDFESYSRLLSP